MQEVIDKIKTVELDSERKIVQARKTADESEFQARIDGKKQIEDAIDDANKRAAVLRREAEEKAAAAASEKIQKAREEAERILEIADGRMETVSLKITERVVDNI